MASAWEASYRQVIARAHLRGRTRRARSGAKITCNEYRELELADDLRALLQETNQPSRRPRGR